MYNTPLGVRVLKGCERRLFAEALAMLIDTVIIEDEPLASGAFESLQRNQKVFVLHTVGRALLCEDEPPPKLTAPIEAAVAAVFGCVRSMVAMELSGELADGDYDTSGSPSWREMVAGACRENAISDEPIDVEDDDPDEWDVLLECLEDCVLWDEDWAMEEQLDLDPDAAGRVKSFLGIEPDYFVAIQPDPSDAEAETLIAELRSLTRVAGQE